MKRFEYAVLIFWQFSEIYLCMPRNDRRKIKRGLIELNISDKMTEEQTVEKEQLEHKLSQLAVKMFEV